MPSITLVSAPGDQWFDGRGNSGGAVLTHGHVGCAAVDPQGFCTAGIWPRIPGAHWIWKSQAVSLTEAIAGIEVVTFWKAFYIPDYPALAVILIEITADNAYEVYLNGDLAGKDGSLAVRTVEKPPYAWSTVELHNPTSPVYQGWNSLEVRVVSYAGDLSMGPTAPTRNPAGLIYRADIAWEPPVGDGPEPPPEPPPEFPARVPVRRRGEPGR